MMGTPSEIKRIRKNLKLTTEEFGNLFNPPASGSLVSRWERGVNLPNAKRLGKIASLGNTTVDRLLNPNDLADYTNQELLDELRSRGHEDITKNTQD